jgi:hypothetical protein
MTQAFAVVGASPGHPADDPESDEVEAGGRLKRLQAARPLPLT